MVDQHKIEGLVVQLQQGDEKALSTLYDMYSGSLYGLVLKIVKDDGLAQDVLQDCFVNIWKKAASYTPSKGSFFTWMLNICRNKSIDELRKVERTRTGKDELAHSGISTSNGLDTNIDTIGIKDILHKLPKEQQVIIDFIYFRGYTQQEVSDELDIPLGTVKTRARMALIELRESFTILIILWILKNT